MSDGAPRDLVLTDARVVTARGVLDGGWVHVAGGRIVDVGPADRALPATSRDGGRPPEVLHADGRWLLPGFVDVHVHGALGHDTMDADPDGLHRMARFYAQHGVTSFVATTWTGTTDATLAALHGVADAMREPATGGARLLGAHLEGPYLAATRCGAQDPALIRVGDAAELRRFLDTGVVRIVTVAPEVPGNHAVITSCVADGVTVGVGHTEATTEQVLTAVSLGARSVTHTFNAMPPLHHRDPGPVAAAMTNGALTAELIADGVHVHPAAMRVLLAAAGPDRVALVSDAVAATGLPPGDHRIGPDRTVTVRDGAVRLPDGALAGSVLTLDAALANLLRAVDGDHDLASLWPVSSRNAARLAGVGDTTGVIEAGYAADLVLVDDAVEVALTCVGGRIVFRADDR